MTSAAAPVSPTPLPTPQQSYSPKAFRKELTAILRELATSPAKNVAMAVRRVREQHVPPGRQGPMFLDILTRTLEERRGIVRRLSLAFVAGLLNGEASAFDRAECVEALRVFFLDTY